MFTKIVVGIDGSTGGRDALAFARAIGGSAAVLVLVNAFPYESRPARSSVGGFEELLHEQSLEALADAAAGTPYECRSVADVSPGRALQHIAEAQEADLIVVGSCRYGAVARVLLGDVSRAVMHGAPCAVAIVPRNWHEAPHRIETVGVGFTRAPESRAALDAATTIARDQHAKLRLRTSVTVPVAFAPAYAYAYDWDAVAAEHRALARADLEEAVAGIDVPVATDTTSGSPAGDLTALSEEVDVLVVGSRGWGAARRVVLGSTSDRLAHHAGCPVLVVPAGAGDRNPNQEKVISA